ncbi:MAG TPA: hypothetical protein VK249_01300, partial [Anaerolineales bacterium]|nr:hypothetical protein [Anaerolineales bacterium]
WKTLRAMPPFRKAFCHSNCRCLLCKGYIINEQIEVKPYEFLQPIRPTAGGVAQAGHSLRHFDNKQGAVPG